VAAAPAQAQQPNGKGTDRFVTLVARHQAPRPGRGHAGEVVTYRVTVSNIGAATAEGIVVADAMGGGGRLVSAGVRGRRCHTARVLYCRIARLRPGRSITSKIRMRLTRPGISRNLAVVYTDSPERRDRRHVAAARLARRPGCPVMRDGAGPGRLPTL
jgi:uncharacterized repeat protein (TIGR01451 family)